MNAYDRFLDTVRSTATLMRPNGSARGWLRMLAAVVVVAGLLGGVLAPVTASAAVTRPGASSRPAASSAPAPPVPVLEWRSCDGGFQCASARVPLDYRHPDGATISIAVLRHVATDPAHRIGSLFFNGGGPNPQIAGFPAIYRGFPAVLRARFDIITFDPRGFGYSTPVRCFPTAQAENKFLGPLPMFPVGRGQDAAWEQTFARFDAVCARRGGALLDHDTTADVARDLDLLRQAVGDPVLNYVGLSYGTGLGATYANLFPARTGHMIMDANLNPVAWTKPGDGLPTFLRQDSDTASAATMTAFLDLCGQAPTARCAFSAGTPAATRAKFGALLRRLRRDPVAIGTPPVVYTYADAITSVPLDVVSLWPEGASLLQQLWIASVSGHGSLAGEASGPAETPAVYSGLEQQLAVECSDSPNPRDPRAFEAAARLAYARAGGFGLQKTWVTEACADWPRAAAQDRYAGPWNRRTASTILVVGNTGDPVLPYADSVAMSRDLARARLLTVDGYGHTEAANPSTCATIDEVRYLLTGALPPSGTTCPQNGTPFGSPAG